MVFLLEVNRKKKKLLEYFYKRYSKFGFIVTVFYRLLYVDIYYAATACNLIPKDLSTFNIVSNCGFAFSFNAL